MEHVLRVARVAIAACGGVLGWFMGAADGLIFALLAFVVIDYLTGVTCAMIDKKLSSEVGAKGIAKKVMIFVLVGIANVIDTQLIKSGAVLRTATIFFYLANEGLSILENAAHLGLPVPDKLKDALAQLKTPKSTDQ